MFGKVKRVFFTGIFGLMYVSFVAQLVYVLGFVDGLDIKFFALGLLTLEWLVLIAARYLSKKSSSNAGGNNGGFRPYRR